MSKERVIEWRKDEESIALPLPKDHDGVVWHIGDFMVLPSGYERVTRMECWNG